MIQEHLSSFRALQGHSGRNLIDPSLQDNVVITSRFFQYIYRFGCGFDLHSIINNGLILGGQNSSNRQTVFSLLIDPRDKGHQDLAKIDFNEPRRVQYLHSAIIFQGILPADSIPKVVRLKIGEVLYEKSYMSLRPPPKISLRHDHDWTRGNVPLGFTVINSQKLKTARS